MKKYTVFIVVSAWFTVGQATEHKSSGTNRRLVASNTDNRGAYPAVKPYSGSLGKENDMPAIMQQVNGADQPATAGLAQHIKNLSDKGKPGFADNDLLCRSVAYARQSYNSNQHTYLQLETQLANVQKTLDTQHTTIGNLATHMAGMDQTIKNLSAQQPRSSMCGRFTKCIAVLGVIIFSKDSLWTW